MSIRHKQENCDVTLDEVDQDVYLWAPDREMTTEDIGRLVTITAPLQGPEVECGLNYRCWDLDYGFGNAVFRTSSTFAATGACITYVGPVGFFDGATTAQRRQLRLAEDLLGRRCFWWQSQDLF